MKEMILSNWHTMRFVVLISGSLLVLHAGIYSSGPSLLLGLFFLLQAVTNTGCLLGACSGGNCQVNSNADMGDTEGHRH